MAHYALTWLQHSSSCFFIYRSFLDESKRQKEEIIKLKLLEIPIENSEKDFRILKEQLDSTSKLYQEENKSIQHYFNHNIEENIAILREEMGKQGESLRELCVSDIQSQTKTVVNHIEGLTMGLQNTNSDFVAMKESFHSALEEVTQMKEMHNSIINDINMVNRKFENVLELNSANINNLKLQLKNQESLVIMKDKDIRNLVENLDSKLSQKVFTEDTMKKIESKFSEIELSNSNVRKEYENIFTKFNDFKVKVDLYTSFIIEGLICSSFLNSILPSVLPSEDNN